LIDQLCAFSRHPPVNIKNKEAPAFMTQTLSFFLSTAVSINFVLELEVSVDGVQFAHFKLHALVETNNFA